MQMAKKNTKADAVLNLAGAVAQRVQIREVRLVNSAIRLGLHLSEDVPGDIGLQTGIKVSHQFAEDAKMLSVVIDLLLRGVPVLAGANEDDSTESREVDVEDGKEIFRLESAFEVKYSLTDTEGLEPANFDAFSRMNGVYNLWPYWREYVQSTLPRMGLPPLTLPVMTQAKIEKMTRLPAGASEKQDSSATEKQSDG